VAGKVYDGDISAGRAILEPSKVTQEFLGPDVVMPADDIEAGLLDMSATACASLVGLGRNGAFW